MPTWVKIADLANAAKISVRAAEKAAVKCLRGGKWNGYRLNVRTVSGHGGNSGRYYEVRLDSLPEELQCEYSAPLPVEIENKAVNTEEIDWRYSAIEPALKHPSRSRQRGAAIKEIASTQHRPPDGSHRRVSERQLRNWIRLYEDNGPKGLAKRTRSDVGRRRVLISRCWDRDCGLSEDARQSVVAKLEREVRSLWAGLQPSSGWYEVQRDASKALLRFTVEAGTETPHKKLQSICRISRPYVERYREFKAVAIHDKDSKTYFDKLTARISRDKEHYLPMQQVMGDVHPIDIYYRRDDGSLATPKGIFWMDVATERLRCLPCFLPKGKGIRQQDVIESFVAMAEDPTWGSPGNLYIDNGGEYNWHHLIADAFTLSVPIYWTDGGVAGTNANRPVTLAQPYNAPAKGLLEGSFAALERKYFSKITGWIGGDRMRKKTANVGKEPEPYHGTEAELRAAIQQVIDVYNDTPRAGRLKGLSPNRKFTEFVENGWQRSVFGPGVLESVFAETEPRRVHQARIKFGGVLYYHDALTNPAIGEWVSIRVPKFGDRRRIGVYDRDDNFVCIAEPDTIYRHDDPAGAIESSRRKTLGRRNIAAMRAETDPIDTNELLANAAADVEPVPVPDIGGVIRLGEEAEKGGRALAKSRAELADERKTKDERRMAEWDATMRLLKRANG